MKHAAATSVSIVLERRPREVRLLIEDDGSGFDPERTWASTNRRERLGLSGIRERLRLIGGTLQVESAPVQGVTLFIAVPLETAQASPGGEA